MPTPATLPPMFQHLPLRYVQKVSATEYSAECPKCGGEPHPNSEFPDRLRLFTEGNGRIWCRRCGFFKFGDQDSDAEPPSPAELERWRREQKAREEARKRSAERALAHLRDEKLWLQYHRQLDAYARKWWRGRGIPDDWQDFWKLGWQDDREIPAGDTRWRSSVATIPLFDHTRNVLNVKYRIVGEEAAQNCGKYRYELYGQPQPMFLTNPDNPLQGHVIAIEGELKAAVTYVYLNHHPTVIIGLPGKNPGAEIIQQLQQAERVTLVLDPGSERDMIKIARAIGIHKCRGVIPPEKIDDGILSAHLNSREINYLLNTGIKLSAFVN